SRRGVLRDYAETHLSAQAAPSRPRPRFPRPDEDEERTCRSKESPCQGPQAAYAEARARQEDQLEQLGRAGSDRVAIDAASSPAPEKPARLYAAQTAGAEVAREAVGSQCHAERPQSQPLRFRGERAGRYRRRPQHREAAAALGDPAVAP